MHEFPEDSKSWGASRFDDVDDYFKFRSKLHEDERKRREVFELQLALRKKKRKRKG